MKNQFVLTSVILLTTAALAPLDSFAQSTGTPRWDDPAAVPVNRARIVIKESAQVEISVAIPGQITKLSPNARGGVVKKGQVVVELDSRLINAQLIRLNRRAESTILVEFANHALKAAEHKLKRKQAANTQARETGLHDIFPPDEVREFELDAVKASAELKKADEDKLLAGLERDEKVEELAQYTVTAPMSGIVTEMHKRSVGSGVRQGDPIMTIVNLDRVTAACVIDIDHEDSVNVGDTVLIRRVKASKTGNRQTAYRSRFDSKEPQLTAVAPQDKQPEESFVGKVTYINPKQIADNTGSFEIEADVQNRSTGLGKFLLRENSKVEAVVIPAR